MMTIVGSLVTILAALLPTILAALAARKPIKEREAIDAIVVQGTDAAVAAELSRVFDAAGGPVGQPTDTVPGAGAESLPAAHH